MPVDYSQYPDNWLTEIRPAILERARGENRVIHCEWCGIPCYTSLWRHPSHADNEALTRNLYTRDKAQAQRWYGIDYRDYTQTIIPTIAHVHDPNPANCELGNLAALCEKCHNGYDAPMRAMNRKRKQLAELEAAGQMRLW